MFLAQKDGLHAGRTPRPNAEFVFCENRLSDYQRAPSVGSIKRYPLNRLRRKR